MEVMVALLAQIVLAVLEEAILITDQLDHQEMNLDQLELVKLHLDLHLLTIHHHNKVLLHHQTTVVAVDQKVLAAVAVADLQGVVVDNLN
jgi:hypothetical protein